MFLLLKELSPPDGLPARTHPLRRGVFNETPSHEILNIIEAPVMDASHLANQWADNPTPTNQNSTSPVDEDGKECSSQKVVVNNLDSHCSEVSEVCRILVHFRVYNYIIII